jgi:CYTH domain-containing protein
MAKEIEYKFLVTDPDFRSVYKPSGYCVIQQGYLTKDNEEIAIRVRLSTEPSKDTKANITVKGGSGLVKSEYEYDIPVTDAKELLALCGDRVILKTRVYVPHGEHTIEVDIFDGKHRGLVVAEIEVNSADVVLNNFPAWLGKDVTNDYRYSNAYLSLNETPE